MYAKYKFELVRGEDRSIPIVFQSRNPETGGIEPVSLTGCEFLLAVRDEITGEEIARLSTTDRSILLGNVVNLEFSEAGEGEEATALLLIFTHEQTEQFACKKAAFDLFVISCREDGEVRQCLMIGEIRVLKGCCYA